MTAIPVYDIGAAAAALLGPDERAWLVGGTVRDLLLHRLPADVDIAVDGDCERLAGALAARLGGSVFSFSERFSTWRVVLDEGHVDLAPLRGAVDGVQGDDGRSGADGRSGGPGGPAALEADLRGRDFTVNAIARPVGGGDLVDPLGGRADLAAGVLRLCSPSAFRDDPLRVLRLARLALEFDLEPADGVDDAARAAAGSLGGVSGERIEQELSALLSLPAAARAARRLSELGALAVVLPELDRCRGVTQNPYHHLDVFDHTLEALEHLPAVVEILGGERFLAEPGDAGMSGVARIVPLSYAVLLHDIAKPDVRAVNDDGYVMFWHHDAQGADLAVAVARRLRMSRRAQDYLARLVRQHLRLGFLVRELPLTRRALVRYRKAVEPFLFEAVALSLADRMATRGEKNPPVALARHFRIARDVFGDTPPAPPRRLLTGDEIMAELGLGQGPEVGEALEALQEEIDCGEVPTKDEARAFVRAWWAGRGEDAAGDGGDPPVDESRGTRMGED